MNPLQKQFESVILKHMTIPRIVTEAIVRKLSARGIRLQEDQRAFIESHVSESILTEAISAHTWNFSIPDPESDELEGAVPDSTDLGLISLGEDDFHEIIDEFLGRLPELVQRMVADMVDAMLPSVKETAAAVLPLQRTDRTDFEARLTDRWREAIDLLEVVISIALEAGSQFNVEFSTSAARNNDWVFVALIRLHARACQVACEVVTLLRAGYADGAHARWRTLHELAVVAFAIKHGGNDLAERYLLHDEIESYKGARLHLEVGLPVVIPPTQSEMEDFTACRDELVERFGVSYVNQYGWAALFVGKDNPNFRDIERAVKMEHVHPYYKLASHNIHANPKGILFRLGLTSGGPQVLLAGPSDAGLADPGQHTAISIGQVTLALLTTQPNVDRLVVCGILQRLQEEVGDAFVAVHREIETEVNELYGGAAEDASEPTTG